MDEENKIGSFGLFSSIAVTVIGVGIFSYPRELASSIDNEGWIVTLISLAICIFFTFIICSIMKRNNYNSLYDILKNCFGSFLGKFFSLIFVFYNLFYISMGLRVFTEVIKMYLLDKTPTEFIIALFILTGIYVVRGGTNAVVKFNELSFWIMFVPIVFILIALLRGADFTNMLPVFQKPLPAYFTALKSTIYTFLGFEIIYILTPFLKNKGKVFRISTYSLIFIALFYILIYTLAISIFDVKVTKSLLWPTITMVKVIEIPGTFIERWDGIVMAIWVLFFITTFINGFNFSSFMLKETANFKTVKTSVTVLCPFIYLFAMYAPNLTSVYNIEELVIYIITPVIFIIIPALILLSRKKLRGGREDEA